MEHFNKIFLSIMMVLSVPLIFLNWVSGITSVIWLGVLGDWKSAIGGVVISFAGPFIISIPMMLSAIPGFFAIKISNSGDPNQFLLRLLLAISGFIQWFTALWGIIIFFISMYKVFSLIRKNIDISHIYC